MIFAINYFKMTSLVTHTDSDNMRGRTQQYMQIKLSCTVIQNSQY